MTMNKIRIGTRKSKLALWQANFIADQLKKFYPAIEIELVHITTKGDKILDSPLSKIGGKGLFTNEIENQLIDGKIDIAVHSLKDIPAQLKNNFTIAAIPKREIPFDAFVSNDYKNFSDLPLNAKIGTSSLRRRAQILSIRSDLQIFDLRGNVDTRLKKLDDKNFDAIILAAAGLKRLGYEDRIKEIISPSIILPAVGQGALAIETLADRSDIIDLLKILDDFETRVAVSAERSFLKVVDGGCQVPIGVYAEISDKKVTIKAIISSLDGKNIFRDKISGSIVDAEILGESLANNLLNSGGREILNQLKMSVTSATTK
ncbi:MAG: hydroxymethylbilane synthase [Selenomonadaceae bacterium]|nr:hydroxymethylbilane synthase [Selenomonadaceae bacterium]